MVLTVSTSSSFLIGDSSPHFLEKVSKTVIKMKSLPRIFSFAAALFSKDGKTGCLPNHTWLPYAIKYSTTFPQQELNFSKLHRKSFRFLFLFIFPFAHKDVLYVLMKRIMHANIKKQKPQTSVKKCNVCAAKIVLSNIIRIVNQKSNRLFDIFTMKVAFSSFYFVLRVLLLILCLF